MRSGHKQTESLKNYQSLCGEQDKTSTISLLVHLKTSLSFKNFQNWSPDKKYGPNALHIFEQIIGTIKHVQNSTVNFNINIQKKVSQTVLRLFKNILEALYWYELNPCLIAISDSVPVLRSPCKKVFFQSSCTCSHVERTDGALASLPTQPVEISYTTY